MITFTPILDRLKALAKQFIKKNENDFLFKPYIEGSKPSNYGNHSPVYKAINW